MTVWRRPSRPRRSRSRARPPQAARSSGMSKGCWAGTASVLARAITVIESELPVRRRTGGAYAGRAAAAHRHARRVGITGVPGVGKSTFIDALGMHLIRERGENVAVLSVDPSSPISGGSILGDKTRMERLAVEERAFIRPSPSQRPSGRRGAAHAGDHPAVRGGGLSTTCWSRPSASGSSETAVRSMTDFFLLLMLAGAGDELQGMKRGIIEMLDGMAINKADGDNTERAERARVEYRGALHLFPASADGWTPRC